MKILSTMKWSNKYFSNSLRDLEENRKKRLDKVDDLLYNIRTGSKVRNKEVKYIEVGLYDINPNPQAKRSIESVLSSLQFVDAILRRANAETRRDAFIAGGSVRDCLLGYYPRDIDVFLPLQPEEDKDDEAVYYSEVFRKIIKPTIDFPVASKTERHPSQFRLEGYDDNELAAYTLYPPDVSPLVYPPQIISREGSVEDIVNSFDYDLVKAYYKDGKFFVAETFPDIVKKGRITVDTMKARDRIHRWRGRTGHELTVRCLEKPQPKKSAFDDLTWTTGTGTTTHRWIVMPQVFAG